MRQRQTETRTKTDRRRQTDKDRQTKTDRQRQTAIVGYGTESEANVRLDVAFALPWCQLPYLKLLRGTGLLQLRGKTDRLQSILSSNF